MIFRNAETVGPALDVVGEMEVAVVELVRALRGGGCGK